MRRVLLVAVIVGLLRAPAAQAAPCAGFDDVDDASPFCASVAWMKNRAITLGCSGTAYCPDDAVTRLQMAAFMFRLGVQNAFLNGGNAYGAAAVLGTTDAQNLVVRVGNRDALRIVQTGLAPNVLVGNNSCVTPGTDRSPTVGVGVRGALIAGGGAPSGGVNGCGAGDFHKVWDDNGTIGGGFGNTAGNGNADVTDAAFATVSGGVFNAATAYGATVAGGDGNQATLGYAAVSGGNANVASGVAAAVPGGRSNSAGGFASLAAGYRAKANAGGSMAFSDSTEADLVNGTANSFVVGFTGGIGMYTNKAQTTGCSIGAGGGMWICSSSRAQKRDFAAIDAQGVLERVAALPIGTWRYRDEAAGALHLGPMAQDFHAAFGLGPDERTIGVLDASGVALAAIQGMNAKLEAALRTKQEELDALRAEVAAMRGVQAEVTALRAAVGALVHERAAPATPLGTAY